MKNTVALARCTEYKTHQVEAAVRRSVDLLGGMARFVEPGQRVLVKPNILSASDPDRAVTSHPLVVRAVVKLAQEAGGRVLIADNPFVPPLGRGAWDTLYEQTGLAAVAGETGVELNTTLIAQQRPHPDGALIKVMDTTSFLTESDVVISVPRLKTHGFMRLTGAVKNLFGTVPGTIKAGFHVKLQTVDRFSEMLLDLVSFVRPALSVMDAIIGMDGDGPSSGDPFPIGAILAAPDPVAMDVAALALVGHQDASVPVISRATARGWSTGRVEDLLLLGDDLASMRVSGFRLPPGGRSEMDMVPKFLLPVATRLLVPSPHVNPQCVGCDLCVDNCPVQTIRKAGGRALIELSGCIRCYCCHEICPERAIDLQQPWLGRRLTALGR
jgi:uncharacterized protein (DUF362 family)